MCVVGECGPLGEPQLLGASLPCRGVRPAQREGAQALWLLLGYPCPPIPYPSLKHVLPLSSLCFFFPYLGFLLPLTTPDWGALRVPFHHLLCNCVQKGAPKPSRRPGNPQELTSAPVCHLVYCPVCEPNLSRKAPIRSQEAWSGNMSTSPRSFERVPEGSGPQFPHKAISEGMQGEGTRTHSVNKRCEPCAWLAPVLRFSASSKTQSCFPTCGPSGTDS